MMDPASRKFLQQEFDKFLQGESFEQAEGYIPPSETK
jgi:Fe-S cluster biosynthesis and repair protein YggX